VSRFVLPEPHTKQKVIVLLSTDDVVIRGQMNIVAQTTTNQNETSGTKW